MIGLKYLCMYTSYLDDSNQDKALRFCYLEYSKKNQNRILWHFHSLSPILTAADYLCKTNIHIIYLQL